MLTPHVEGLVKAGDLIFRFAKVNRVTLYEDGIRPESDTDHTVMLSVCACSLAELLYKDVLDIGKVAQFAIVHDLVEAYVGDTDTFGIDDVGRKEKEEREHGALLKMKAEFDTLLPWIGDTVTEYESLKSKEAKFVKTVDKCMSKVTHILNGGQYFKNRQIEESKMLEDYKLMVTKVSTTYGNDFPEIIIIMNSLIEEARKKTYE